MDKALAVVHDADDSSLSKLCECLHQGLEEKGVVGPRGGIGARAVDFSSTPCFARSRVLWRIRLVRDVVVSR